MVRAAFEGFVRPSTPGEGMPRPRYADSVGESLEKPILGSLNLVAPLRGARGFGFSSPSESVQERLDLGLDLPRSRDEVADRAAHELAVAFAQPVDGHAH